MSLSNLSTISSIPTSRIEENLRKVLDETDLIRFENVLVFQLSLTRLEHFTTVRDEELEVWKILEGQDSFF